VEFDELEIVQVVGSMVENLVDDDVGSHRESDDQAKQQGGNSGERHWRFLE
jgi:hypothetical protein